MSKLASSNDRPGTWKILRQDTTSPSLSSEDDLDQPLPLYEPFSPPAKAFAPTPRTSRVARPSDSGQRQVQSFLSMEPQDTFTFTYSLIVGNAPTQVFILVESEPEKPNHYTFSLSIKVGHVERAISKPVTMRLSLDPRQLDFTVFAFPPRTSLPSNCLYNLRVWLHTSGIDHRLFAESDLWIGKDPDFRSISDASFAILRNATQDMLIYQALVGRAHVNFIVRWKLVEVGAGKTLFENYHLRLNCEPHTVSFVIYSIPIPSTPSGASHRLRVWLRTPHRHLSPSSYLHSYYTTDSYLYQRLFKLDDFKLGASLNFDTLSLKAIIATRDHPSPLESHIDIATASDTEVNSAKQGYGYLGASSNWKQNPVTRRRSKLVPILAVNSGSGERVDDR